MLWTIDRLRFSGRRAAALHGMVQVPMNDQQKQALLWFRELAAARKMKLVVALFPRFFDHYSQPELRYAEGLMIELEIPYVNLLHAMTRDGPLSRLARDAVHPTAVGQRIAVEAILVLLKTSSGQSTPRIE